MPATKAPRPRRQIIWLRAAPIFLAMMLALFGSQYFLLPRFPDNPIMANGGLGLSLIAGIVGAFLISRFATVDPQAKRPAPGPGMSKTQRRKLERAERLKNEPEASRETGEPVIADVPSRPKTRRRRR